MLEFIGELAKQGLGYLLAVIEGFIIYFIWKENKILSTENKELSEKRVEDLKQIQEKNYANAESMKSAYFSNIDGVKKIVDSTYSVVTNMQNLLNILINNKDKI